MLQNILFVFIVAIRNGNATIKKAFLFHTEHFGENVWKEVFYGQTAAKNETGDF